MHGGGEALLSSWTLEHNTGWSPISYTLHHSKTQLYLPHGNFSWNKTYSCFLLKRWKQQLKMFLLSEAEKTQPILFKKLPTQMNIHGRHKKMLAIHKVPLKLQRSQLSTPSGIEQKRLNTVQSHWSLIENKCEKIQQLSTRRCFKNLPIQLKSKNRNKVEHLENTTKLKQPLSFYKV